MHPAFWSHRGLPLFVLVAALVAIGAAWKEYRSLSMLLALAGTSVGRGWDTVGHAAGIYRNEMILEPVPSCVAGTGTDE